MLLWILRVCFVALVLGVGLVALDNYPPDTAFVQKLPVFICVMVLGGAVLASDLVIRDKQITTISAIYFGLLLGLLIGTITASALNPFLANWFGNVPRLTETIKLLITIICCYISVSTLLQTKDEF